MSDETNQEESEEFEFFCDECGTQVTEAATSCPECGASFEDGQSPSRMQTQFDILGLEPEEPPLDLTESAETVEMADGDQNLWNPTLLKAARESLDRWALKRSVKDDPYVKDLSQAIQDQSNMTMWASLDPYERLPLPPPKAGRLLHRITQVLLALRNVLVFVPVAITWWAIGQATDAFGKYKPNIPVGEKISFLDFWQDGYGLLDDKLVGLVGPKIQEIALADFAIITSVVVLTLFTAAVGAIADKKVVVEEELIESERNKVALELTDALESKRSASPETIAGSITAVVNDLVDGAREVRLAAVQLAQATAGMASFSSQLDNLNRSIQSLSTQVATHISGQIVQSVDSLGQSVKDLNTAVSGDLRQHFAEILTNLENIHSQLDRTGKSVEFGTVEFRKDLEAIHQIIERLEGPLQS